MGDGHGASLLTRALLRPLRDDYCAVSTTELERLSNELADLVADRPGAGPFRLTDYVIRAALAESGAGSGAGTGINPPEQGGRSTPFAWSSVTARRALGLAAVRSLVDGSAHSPVEGARAAIARAISDAGEGHRSSSSSSMDQWLAQLPGAGRAAVEAEAVTWATRLWTALSWTDCPVPPTIGRDHWWDSPRSSLLALRSRAEVRTTTTWGREHHLSVHLTVLGGPRRDTVRSELSVVALAESLRSRTTLPPGRIVGWWPDSGRFVDLEVNRHTLSVGVAAVARTLESMSASRGAGTAPKGAAA
jgi:hypothetical protein